jgi:hypothetical protein
MIPYVEINNEHQTAQFLAAGRSSATKHARGNGIISDNVSLAVALLVVGKAFVALQFLKRFYLKTPFIKTNGSLSRPRMCGATNTPWGKRPQG